MARRRRPDTVDVEVSIECNNGHLVGRAYKRGLVTSTGRQYVVSNGVLYRDAPGAAASTSGRVRGVCGQCGQDVQIKWERVKQLLDECAIEGKWRGARIAP